MSTEYSAQEKRSRISGIVGAASGNLVEWFDFYIYAVFAVYFTHALTAPDMDDTTKSIYVWGVFAASFFMRPIGSWFFGRLADQHGRKKSMVVSICVMAVSSFLFALLPTYEQVGLLAPFLLLLVRLLQGLSVGGEYGAVATYMSEIGLKGRKGFFSSFQYVTLSGGQLLASLLSVIMLAFLTKAQLEAGWWRLPFVIGGCAALVSLFARRHLEETLSTKDSHQEGSGTLRELFKNHWKRFLLVVGYTSAGSLAFYTITVYSKTYLSNTLGLADQTVGYIMTLCLLVFMIAQPFFGIFADRLGRRTAMLAFSGLLAIFIYPVMAIAMPYFASQVWLVAILLVFMMLILSFYTSISGLVKAEMFPTHVRALGVGFSYAVGNALFGGSAPSLALQFKAVGFENIFFIYVSIMLMICFLCSLAIPKDPEYLHQEP
ncbi:MFS transporter [Acinetobacter apis]|uniref:MFS transporter, MHS family, dicarboxylic acid transporter PcaT n=1 Tax=Acinetobacter apis TaxID=1229165 RepID=A0A217EHF1_9GAMM|nr:MFS transporter [Acinetobacter apis]SNQ29939.1 MFS transporter, MHS family, dicarboxylic acid transporter PcaT [Acinetobacter apis]